MKLCDKTCIFFFFPIINKYFLMAKRSLLSRCPSYKRREDEEEDLSRDWMTLRKNRKYVNLEEEVLGSTLENSLWKRI